MGQRRESPGRAARSPAWTELRDSGGPAGDGRRTPLCQGVLKATLGWWWEGEAEGSCLGENLGVSRAGSPKEVTQTPCHTTRVVPQVRILAVALAAMGSTVLWPG